LSIERVFDKTMHCISQNIQYHDQHSIMKYYNHLVNDKYSMGKEEDKNQEIEHKKNNRNLQ